MRTRALPCHGAKLTNKNKNNHHSKLSPSDQTPPDSALHKVIKSPINAPFHPFAFPELAIMPSMWTQSIGS